MRLKSFTGVLMLGIVVVAVSIITTALPRAVAQPSAAGLLVRGFLALGVGGKNTDTPGIVPGKPTPRTDVYLPGIEVTLVDPQTNARTKAVVTDLSGRFTTRAPAPGRYRVCWDGKILGDGCVDKFVSISGNLTNVGTQHATIKLDADEVTVYGRVTLADGSSPRYLDPLANVNARASVALLDQNGGQEYEVLVNNLDQYLLPRVKIKAFHKLEVRDEKYSDTQPLVFGTDRIKEPTMDLIIHNLPPVIDPLWALESNKIRAINPAAGSTVLLAARVSDKDQDQLGFLWRVSAGSLSDASDPQPKWTLPNRAGDHTATLLVFDGRGGYAESSLKLTTNKNGVEFSGFVSATDALALKGATVEIGGRTAVTDSSGFFRIRLTDRKRFIMNIRKPGYGFASNIYYDSVIGGRWRLTRATVFSVDPSTFKDLQNKRSSRDCPGAPSDRLNWKGNAALAKPQFQDGRGNIVTTINKENSRLPGLPGTAQNRDRACARGVRVKIAANSLVDAQGKKPLGKINVQLSTVDLQSSDQMPGNYSVVTPNGDVRVMQSYGAGVIELYSGATKYNLRPGAQATVIIPPDPAQLASGEALPSTIPLLSYDEARGIWMQDGTAVLKTVDGQPAYVAKVKHFTAYNADNIKTDQSCLAVQNQGMPAAYNLELTIPTTSGGVPVAGAAPIKRLLIGMTGGNTETAILNLPKNTNIVLVPIRTTDANPNLNNLPIGVFVVNTGAPQNPAVPTVPGGWTNEPVPPYYHETAGVPDGACSTKVLLKDLGLGYYPQTPKTGAFLHGLGIGSFAAVNLTDLDPNFPLDANTPLRDAITASSAAYRAQIDKRSLRPTLSCFKVTNRMPLRAGESCPQHAGLGFVPGSVLPEVTAAYANTVDLGFGREMHCVQDGAKATCYVSNYDSLVYTGPGQGGDVTKAQHAVEGLNGTRTPDATVAMEFSPLEDDTPDGTPVTSLNDPEPIVKFYVFNAAGNPVDAANLDGLGARPVPQLCMVCHGGQIPNPTGVPSTAAGTGTPVFSLPSDVKLDSRFLPFDLQSFSYAAPDSDAANLFSKLNQQTAFKNLNNIAKIAPPPDAADPPSNAVDVLVNAWYPGNVIPQIESAVVPLWNTDAAHQTMYRNVIAKSCRTCHVSNTSNNLRFEQPSSVDSQLGVVQSRVCQDHIMPHARRTHDLFWTSLAPNQPAELQVYGDTLNTGGWERVGTAGVDPSKACGGEDEFGARTFTPGGGTLASPNAFTPAALGLSAGGCSGCHNASNAAVLNPGDPGFYVARLNLESAVAYGNIVGVNSVELPARKLVQLGVNTEVNSYLWNKISNTHTGLGAYVLGGPGGAMPLNNPPLTTTNPSAAIAIRDWIRGGAGL